MNMFPMENVNITSGFLKDKQEMNRKITINSVYDRFCDSGRLQAFHFDWKEGQPNKPHYFYDSDMAKWAEGASYILKKHPDPKLQEKIENLIDLIEEHQGEDGYFNIYFTVCEPGKRFTDRSKHELYCAGHLIESAVAYAEATGRERYLNCIVKYVDYIQKVFIEDRSASFITPGHEEIELALFKLYRYTGNKKYFELAKFFLNERGNHETECDNYTQSHKPIRQQDEALGHAVRAMYLYTAMADLAFEDNDNDVAQACRKLYANITEKKMYVTGGIGSTYIGEAFTAAYDLPNEEAYAETCAAIGMMFFCQRMLKLENKAAYADTIERAFYNGVLSGISLDGKSFFYENPLEITMMDHFSNIYGERRFPITQRLECFECSCCPPNLNRLLSVLEEYIYGIEGDTLFVNQFASSKLESGSLRCEMITDYPNSGKISITASGIGQIAVRIPGWCSKFSINKPYELKDGYAYIRNDGSTTTLDLDMTPFALHSDSRVIEDINKLCIQAGPIVYCAESVDNGENLHSLFVSPDFSYDFLPGNEFLLRPLKISAFRIKNVEQGLYTKARPLFAPTTVKLIPYNSFANRGESDMLVWFNAKL